MVEHGNQEEPTIMGKIRIKLEILGKTILIVEISILKREKETGQKLEKTGFSGN